MGNHPLADEMDAVSVPHAEARQNLLSDIRGRKLGPARPAIG